MFAIARSRVGLALFGLAILIGGVTARLSTSAHRKTVVERVSIWLSPWDNDVRGGDQLAHSLWAFSTGGAWGSGPGLGDPAMIPAGHTDLVLPAIGEEWGFAGVVSDRSAVRVSGASHVSDRARAPDELAMFLSLGLGRLIALEMLLDLRRRAGRDPALRRRFAVPEFGKHGDAGEFSHFRHRARDLEPAAARRTTVWRSSFRAASSRSRVGFLWACASTLLAGRPIFRCCTTASFWSTTRECIEEDGVKRAQFNPRLNSLARTIPRGDHLRPQRRSSRHQQLERTGTASRRLRTARRLH